jgi:hypothetical protein
MGMGALGAVDEPLMPSETGGESPDAVVHVDLGHLGKAGGLKKKAGPPSEGEGSEGGQSAGGGHSLHALLHRHAVPDRLQH